jgi:hypothetical protein
MATQEQSNLHPVDIVDVVDPSSLLSALQHSDHRATSVDRVPGSDDESADMPEDTVDPTQAIVTFSGSTTDVQHVMPFASLPGVPPGTPDVDTVQSSPPTTLQLALDPHQPWPDTHPQPNAFGVYPVGLAMEPTPAHRAHRYAVHSTSHTPASSPRPLARITSPARPPKLPRTQKVVSRNAAAGRPPLAPLSANTLPHPSTSPACALAASATNWRPQDRAALDAACAPLQVANTEKAIRKSTGMLERYMAANLMVEPNNYRYATIAECVDADDPHAFALPLAHYVTQMQMLKPKKGRPAGMFWFIRHFSSFVSHACPIPDARLRPAPGCEFDYTPSTIAAFLGNMQSILNREFLRVNQKLAVPRVKWLIDGGQGVNRGNAHPAFAVVTNAADHKMRHLVRANIGIEKHSVGACLCVHAASIAWHITRQHLTSALPCNRPKPSTPR